MVFQHALAAPPLYLPSSAKPGVALLCTARSSSRASILHQILKVPVFTSQLEGPASKGIQLKPQYAQHSFTALLVNVSRLVIDGQSGTALKYCGLISEQCNELGAFGVIATSKVCLNPGMPRARTVVAASRHTSRALHYPCPAAAATPRRAMAWAGATQKVQQKNYPEPGPPR